MGVLADTSFVEAGTFNWGVCQQVEKNMVWQKNKSVFIYLFISERPLWVCLDTTQFIGLPVKCSK